MNNRTKLISIVLFLSALLMLESCQQQKAEWKGTIEEVNGVTVIKNPNEPLYGELVFDLEEDLSIGNEEDDNYMFYKIRDIKVDKDENIYVLEGGNIRIQKFDRDGNYLCTIGRQGQGPGEFQRPSQILIDDKKGIVCVRNGRKLIIFDKDGNFLDEDIPFDEFFYDLLLDANGDLWGINFVQEGLDDIKSPLFKVLVKINTKGHIENNFSKFPYDMFQERSERGGISSVATGYEYDLFISLIDENNLVYGYSKEYELNIIDSKGNLLRKIKKDEPYQKFTAEEKGKRKRAKFPEHKPFFYSLITDSKDRIYAQGNNARRIQTVAKEFDIFSKDGYCLYKTIFQMTPYEIRNEFFYTRIINKDSGEVFVKRYKIKNWEQIKEGI